MQNTRITTLVRYFGLCLLGVALTAGVLRADWSYTDSFNTNRAENDSAYHSTFWSTEITPLAEPYLFYLETDGARGLVFIDCQDRPAELCYRFPLGAAQAGQPVEGIVGIDVSFPCNDRVSQFPGGRLLYSVSPDGLGWSKAQALDAGHTDIPISSPTGTCYILFTGTRAMIDNLDVSLSGPSTTLRVPRDFRTIQDAIDAARDGDVIEVAAGKYSGPGNRDIDFRGKKITLRSAAGPEDTIIDCGGASSGGVTHRGFYFHEGEGADSVLSGFTIQGGRAFGSQIPSASSYWSFDASVPIGGGIYCEFSGPTIADCVITDCGAELGGGIGGVGAAPMIVDCLIEQCTAGGFGTAGSGGRGGGAGFMGDSDLTITGSTIRDNAAYYNSFGAGLYFADSAALVAGCTISNNAAPGTLWGGGAYCTGSTTAVTFKNCVIAQNQADQGGGIFAESSTSWPRGEVAVTNCTIAHNTLSGYAPSLGGGIHSTRVDVVVSESIVWYNSATPVVIQGASVASGVTYSDVEGGYAGVGNIEEEPMFAVSAAADYHLQSNYGRYDARQGRWMYDAALSPCVDAGDPTASVAGELLPNGGRLNMGAYGGTQQASKGTEHFVYHVDGVNGRDWNNGLSKDRPFATIRKAINTAHDGDTILVWPGIYAEPVIVRGKAITIQSATDAAVITAPATDGVGVSFYYAESSRSVLKNFVITGCGQMAIYCDSGASPTLQNLTVVGNSFGIAVYDGAEPSIVNCILWNNGGGDVWRDAESMNASSWEELVRYSCTEQRASNTWAGNISVKPLFADPDNGDYHLQSLYGRYVPGLDTWVTDSAMSPCVDAGDPDEYPVRGERMPNGGRINLGAYGGTAFASLSSGPLCPDF